MTTDADVFAALLRKDLGTFVWKSFLTVLPGTRYLQNWHASNLFVVGGSAYPQNAGHNPTGTIGALAYWSANAITTKYLKSPGPLVHA